MDNSSENTIIIYQNPHKKTKHGVVLVLNTKRIEQNERHKFSLRDGK